MIIFLILQLQIDIAGDKYDISRVDYEADEKVVYIRLDEIYRNGFES